jgi:hypothetical protein
MSPMHISVNPLSLVHSVHVTCYVQYVQVGKGRIQGIPDRAGKSMGGTPEAALHPQYAACPSDPWPVAGTCACCLS